jgi:hypothetical protein
LYALFKSALDNRREETSCESTRSQEKQKDAFWDQVLAASVTGGITAFCTTPIDVVKTKLMVDDYMGASFLDCFASTVDVHGWSAVFAGVGARIGWVLPFTAIYLPLYDHLKRELWKRHLQELQN